MYIEIPLTRGLVSLVDSVDADLSGVKWLAHKDKKKNSAYAVREVTDRSRSYGSRTERLHRVVLERKLGRTLLKTEYVDHINRDGLDNRRENLRVATTSQNMQNTVLRKDNTSGYKGVVFNRRKGLWYVRIQIKGVKKSYGYYKTKEEAALVYAQKAKELFGEFANP